MALKDLLTEEDFQSIYLQSFPLHEEFNYGAGPTISTGLNKNKDNILNFKTIPFGKDQPKGGNSRQPYIKSNIPEGTENYAFKPYALFGDSEVGLTSGGGGVLETINSISSGLIRGGIIGAGIHSVTDVLRLTQFGIDLERGIPFIAKQVGLQLSNVKLEAPSPSAEKPFNNNRIYNLGVNTIAQAGVNAFGLHFKRHGLFPSPSNGQDDETGYYYLATRNNAGDSKDNRLFSLLTKFRNGNQDEDERRSDIKELYSYNGGPKSVYGIGKTTIRSYTNTLDNPRHDVALAPPSVINTAASLGIVIPPPGTRFNQIDLDRERTEGISVNGYTNIGYPTSTRVTKTDGGNKDYNADFPHTKEGADPTSKIYTTIVDKNAVETSDNKYSVNNLYNYLSLDQISSQQSRITPGNKRRIYAGNVKDFRRVKAASAGGDVALKKYYLDRSSNYEEENMERRLQIGTGADFMGDLKVIRTESGVTPGTDGVPRDLINFFIEAIDNDSPSLKDHIQFRAFLGSFNENYSAKWKSYNFVGNPEPFYNYDSFDRGVSLSFTIAAFRKEELKPLYVRLNTLISQLFPDYKANSTRSRAPYVTLTVGDYLNRQPGFIESIGIKWDKEIAWEIGPLDDTKSPEIQVLPHVLEVDMKFQPIHNFVPRKIKPTDSNVPFITLNSRNSDQPNVWIGKDGNFKIDPSATEFTKKQEEAAEKERIKQDKLKAEAADEQSKKAAEKAEALEKARQAELAREESRKAQAIKDKKAADEQRKQDIADAKKRAAQAKLDEILYLPLTVVTDPGLAATQVLNNLSDLF